MKAAYSSQCVAIYGVVGCSRSFLDMEEAVVRWCWSSVVAGLILGSRTTFACFSSLSILVFLFKDGLLQNFPDRSFVVLRVKPFSFRAFSNKYRVIFFTGGLQLHISPVHLECPHCIFNCDGMFVNKAWWDGITAFWCSVFIIFV